MISTGPLSPRSRERFAGRAAGEPTHRPLERRRQASPAVAVPVGCRLESHRPSDRLVATLSRREREVLRLLASRFTDREIAAALSISYRTATTHVANIFNKLGVNSRRDAAAAYSPGDEG
jgi:DNA-binding CsgD family transcriptional regulator